MSKVIQMYVRWQRKNNEYKHTSFYKIYSYSEFKWLMTRFDEIEP